jgi:hypothetical protein
MTGQEHLDVTEVTITATGTDGSHREWTFYHPNDNPFDLLIDKPSGWPTAQTGGMTFHLPRWPACESYVPHRHR